MTDEPTRQPYQGLVSKTVIVLRWLLFVPAGLAGGVVVSIIWGAFGAFAYWLYGWSTPQASPWSPASKMGNSFLCGYAMVAIGAFVAPTTRKVRPAIITLIAAVAFASFGSVAALVRSDIGGVIYNICIAAGGVAAVYHASHSWK
jgi:hypothetical protein